jgi:predicted nucleic-acid-binding protein
VKGLDTNVLLRLLLADDPAQTKRAVDYVEHGWAEAPCWINCIVLCETVWVLERSLGLSRTEIAGVVERLLQADELTIEDAKVVRSALYAYRISRAGFTDCLIGMSNGFLGCERTATFDRKAAELDEFELI